MKLTDKKKVEELSDRRDGLIRDRRDLASGKPVSLYCASRWVLDEDANKRADSLGLGLIEAIRALGLQFIDAQIEDNAQELRRYGVDIDD